MDYLLAHGTGSAGKILASKVLLGGSKAASQFGEKSATLGEDAPADEIFFSKMNIGQNPDYFNQTVTTRSYAKRPAKPKDVRGVLLFSPACTTSGQYQDKGAYGVITAKSVPLAALDPQIFIFIQEDLPAVQGTQDALKKLLSDNSYFASTPLAVESALHFYPAVMPLAALTNAEVFDGAIDKILGSAKAFGFCYTYDNSGRVIP